MLRAGSSPVTSTTEEGLDFKLRLSELSQSVTCKHGLRMKRFRESQFAGVMELADVTVSKSVDGDIVRVRVPLPAPIIICTCGEIGRHARFRFLCPMVCRFKSCQVHHNRTPILIRWLSLWVSSFFVANY